MNAAAFLSAWSPTMRRVSPRSKSIIRQAPNIPSSPDSLRRTCRWDRPFGKDSLSINTAEVDDLDYSLALETPKFSD
jgi:hypothetical protein